MSSAAGCGGDFDVGGGGASAASTAQGTSDASSASATSQGTSVATTGSSTTASASASISASSSTGMVICDDDEDGAEIEAAGCCTVPSACDCDDTSAAVFPGQTAFFTEPRASAPDPMLAWDYDCDGIATTEYPFDAVGCPNLLCAGPEVTFKAPDPAQACGSMVTVSTCMSLVCTQMMAPLGCR